MIITDLRDRLFDSGIRTAVTVGKFDGLHLGHRELIRAAAGKKQEGLSPLVLLIDMNAGAGRKSILDSEEEYRNCFENYAKIWSTLYRKDDLLMYLDDDTHSPSLVRVNAVLSCFDEFYETYDVREGDGMYLPPEERLTRW